MMDRPLGLFIFFVRLMRHSCSGKHGEWQLALPMSPRRSAASKGCLRVIISYKMQPKLQMSVCTECDTISTHRSCCWGHKQIAQTAGAKILTVFCESGPSLGASEADMYTQMHL